MKHRLAMADGDMSRKEFVDIMNGDRYDEVVMESANLTMMENMVPISSDNVGVQLMLVNDGSSPRTVFATLPSIPSSSVSTGDELLANRRTSEETIFTLQPASPPRISPTAAGEVREV